MLERDHTFGVNGIISAQDMARGEFHRLRRSRLVEDTGWEHLDPLHFREHSPWDPTPEVSIRFFAAGDGSRGDQISIDYLGRWSMDLHKRLYT